MDLGTHVIFDAVIENQIESGELSDIMAVACSDAGATILSDHWHEFDNGGFTGVILLAESHATVHYWIEHKTITVDVYMCGDCDPVKAACFMLQHLNPVSINFKKIRRKIP